MIKAFVRTNLDVRESWPSNFESCPRVGDTVVSNDGLELVVASVTWRNASQRGFDIIAVPTLELTMPPNRFASIAEFNNWYFNNWYRGAT